MNIEILIRVGMVVIVILGIACLVLIVKIINKKRKVKSRIKHAKNERIEW